MNGYSCVTELNILTKRLSTINTVSEYELSSTAKRRMCQYKEFVHSSHVQIKFNASTNDKTEKVICTETEMFQ